MKGSLKEVSELAPPLSVAQIEQALTEIRRKAGDVVASVLAKGAEDRAAVRSTLLEQVHEICLHYLQNLCRQRMYQHKVQEARHHNELLEQQLQLLMALAGELVPPDGPEGQPDAAGREAQEAVKEQIHQLLRLCRERSGGGTPGSMAAAAVASKAGVVERTPPPAPAADDGREIEPGRVVLEVNLLGGFRVVENGVPVKRWPKGKGKQILKYLLIHRHGPVPKEVLMEVFWPGQEVTNARNNLNVAIYGIRRAFRKVRPGFFHIIFQNGAYQLNPEIHVWVDAEAFMDTVREGRQLEAQGRREAAMALYRKAIDLYYGGDLLPEDAYEDWASELREEYRRVYLDLLNRLGAHYLAVGDIESCQQVSHKLVAAEHCEEAAHERLMRCYVALGQRHLALRQFKLCEESLRRELGLAPCERIRKLYEEIRRREEAAVLRGAAAG